MINLKSISAKIKVLFVMSFVLSIITSSYFEQPQMKFFAAIKSVLQHGSISRFSGEGSTLYTHHDGEYYVNPVHVLQQVLPFSEESLIKLSDVDVSGYSFFTPSAETADVIKIADFMIESSDVESINGVEVVRFPYAIEYQSYELSSPWYSGMAQGHAIIVFLHAYTITGDVRYLDYALLSANTLATPLEDGGVLLEAGGEGVWFEEYADPTKDSDMAPRVLNGHVFAVDGLFWAWFVTQNVFYRDLLVRSIAGVESTIGKYDSGFWSYYGLHYNFAHAGYHSIHIEQLNRLLEYSSVLGVTETEDINTYKDKFRGYKNLPFLGYIQRLLYQRNNMIYVILISNISFFFVVFCGLTAIGRVNKVVSNDVDAI